MLDPEALFSIKLSLKVAILSCIFVFILGLPVSYILSSRSFPFKNLLDALITLPLVFPPTVTGYILLLILGKNGIRALGRFMAVIIAGMAAEMLRSAVSQWVSAAIS